MHLNSKWEPFAISERGTDIQPEDSGRIKTFI